MQKQKFVFISISNFSFQPPNEFLIVTPYVIMSLRYCLKRYTVLLDLKLN